jgi:hypothetical protein
MPSLQVHVAYTSSPDPIVDSILRIVLSPGADSRYTVTIPTELHDTDHESVLASMHAFF